MNNNFKKCEVCNNENFKIIVGGTNGSVSIECICAVCNSKEELIDTYSDNNY